MPELCLLLSPHSAFYCLDLSALSPLISISRVSLIPISSIVSHHLMSSTVFSFGASASDFLRSTSIGAVGDMPHKFFGRSRVSTDFSMGESSRGVNVVAKIVKKGKVKHKGHTDKIEPNSNVKGGILGYLSEFKSHKEKPKPVTMPFEKPLVNLEKKIMDV